MCSNRGSDFHKTKWKHQILKQKWPKPRVNDISQTCNHKWHPFFHGLTGWTSGHFTPIANDIPYSMVWRVVRADTRRCSQTLRNSQNIRDRYLSNKRRHQIFWLANAWPNPVTWRTLNTDKHRYTWCRKKPEIRCRLDFVLVSSDLICDINLADIVPGYKTDHSMILR